METITTVTLNSNNLKERENKHEHIIRKYSIRQEFYETWW